MLKGVRLSFTPKTVNMSTKKLAQLAAEYNTVQIKLNYEKTCAASFFEFFTLAKLPQQKEYFQDHFIIHDYNARVLQFELDRLQGLILNHSYLQNETTFNSGTA